MTPPSSCVYLLCAFLKPNTLEKFRVFPQHSEKIIVFLESALISLWPSVRNFNLECKKTIEAASVNYDI